MSESTSLEWVRWTRDVMPRLLRERAISRGEGLMLKELGCRADRRGGCFASARTLGEGIGVDERQAERLLRGLRAKKLISTRRLVDVAREELPAGVRNRRGCLRTLQPGAVPGLLTGQLSFDDLLDDVVPAPVVQELPVEPRPVAAPAAPPTFSERPPTSGCRTKEEKVVVKEGNARCARDTSSSRPDLVALGVDLDPSPVLEPQLTAVLQALSGAPNLLLEPMNVNAALAAHPESKGHDHLCAALTLVSLSLGEQRSTLAHPRLLGVLQRQSRPAPAQRAPWTPAHDGRARRAAPAPANTPTYTRQD